MPSLFCSNCSIQYNNAHIQRNNVNTHTHTHTQTHTGRQHIEHIYSADCSIIMRTISRLRFYRTPYTTAAAVQSICCKSNFEVSRWG